MIVGLDHLSLNVKNKKIFNKGIAKYQKIYKKKKINHKEKKKFLKLDIKNHHIGFYNIDKNFPPIEMTFYRNSNLNAQRIIVKKNIIKLNVSSKKKEFFFWEKVFNLKEKGNIIDFFSFYDKKKYKFHFRESTIKKKDYLDSVGFTSICFISTDIKKKFKSCNDFNIEISNIFKFKLNQKKMKIFFCRSPGGIIFEIIQYYL